MKYIGSTEYVTKECAAKMYSLLVEIIKYLCITRCKYKIEKIVAVLKTVDNLICTRRKLKLFKKYFFLFFWKG